MALHSTSERYKYIYGSNAARLDGETAYPESSRRAGQAEKDGWQRRAVRKEREVRPSDPQKQAAVRNNIAKLKEFDWKFTIVVVASLVLIVTAGLVYLQGTVQLHDLSTQIASLKSEREDLLSEQNALQTEIDKNINLDEIRTFAEEELDMVYPGPGQVIYYNSSTSDYFRQYESVDLAN